jgi:2-oxoglutarate ferredoxin oxidoreductase subunit beta
MAKVYKKTSMLTDKPFHYCPGCSHGIVHKLLAECIEELGQQGNCIGIAPVGCAVFAYDYFNCDMQQASHGRAPAVATGIKRVQPDKLVFAYQGDGDLASIGTAEIVHAAARGENFTVIFINNAIYGMPGGQMAPPTMIGQKATTCQTGRNPFINGNPINVSEMLSQLIGPAYIERVSTHDLKNVIKTKKAIKKALQYQLDGKGFSMVEVLSTCPTNWKMTPIEAADYIKNEMTKIFPLGVFKDKEAGK